MALKGACSVVTGIHVCPPGVRISEAIPQESEYSSTRESESTTEGLTIVSRCHAHAEGHAYRVPHTSLHAAVKISSSDFSRKAPARVPTGPHAPMPHESMGRMREFTF
jgi:hypothetical protein